MILALFGKKKTDSAIVDRKNETGDTFKKIGKISLKVLSYISNVVLTLLLVVFLVGIIVGSTFAVYIKNYVDPDIDASLLVGIGANKTTQLYYTDSDGKDHEIEDQRIYGADNGIWVSYDKFPKELVDAFVSIEDHRFFSHNGVDWLTTTRAVFNYFLKFKGNFGASTITQQLVKNVTGDNEVKITRKVQEICRALNLEKEYSKEQILEMYLNVIYFGNNCNGVQTAAETYFGKDVSELNLVECATLAGIVKNPYSYNPVNYPEECIDRRNDVISEMLDNGKIDEATAKAAYDTELVLSEENKESEQSNPTSSIFNWYTEAVFNEVQNDLMESYGYTKYSAAMAIYTGGFKIYTCMDPEVQSVLEEVYYNDDEYFPMAASNMQPESAMVICDPYDGRVLGLVGARGDKVTNRILNRATDTLRPPGSSIKPLSVYGPSIDRGIITYGSVYDDVPVNFGDDKENPKAWPLNLPAVNNGLTTVKSALERSVNTVAVRILQDLTPEESYKFLTKELGFTSIYDRLELASGTIMSDIDLAPLALGQLSYGVSVKEITAAYSIFANDGIYTEPRLYNKVIDGEGNVILSNEKKSKVVISEQAASVMTKLMYNVVNDPSGTAYWAVTLKDKVDVAGKTGTSSSDFDRWFVAYTPYYIGGIWFGYDNNIALSAFSVNPASTTWDIVMTKLHQKYIDADANGTEELKTFKTAPGVIECTYCKDSGKLMTDACRLDIRGDRSETGWFIFGTEPSEYCDTHVKVKYCTECNAVASPDCKNTREVGLIKNDTRNFPYQISVTDAQYVYRDMPAKTKYGGWWGEPFFVNALPAGTYAGISNVEYQANAYCWLHGK